MSIFDDIPLENGTRWDHGLQAVEIVGFNSESQKYTILKTFGGKTESVEMSRETVEEWHGNAMMKGVEVTQIHRASPQNTRFYRRNPDKGTP